MFKKSLLCLLIPAVLAMFLASCATFDKAAMERTKTVAVLSVYCDKKIDASDFQGLGAAISTLAQNKDFNLDSQAVKMKDDLFNEYTKVFSFKLLDDQTVLATPNYMNADAKSVLQMNQNTFACPPGYRAYSMIIKQPIVDILKQIPTADGGLILYTTFKLKKVVEFLGFGTAKVQALTFLIVKDKDFKTVFYNSVDATSQNTIKFALGGVFDASQIQPLCVEAASAADSKMKAWLMKQYSK